MRNAIRKHNRCCLKTLFFMVPLGVTIRRLRAADGQSRVRTMWTVYNKS